MSGDPTAPLKIPDGIVEAVYLDATHPSKPAKMAQSVGAPFYFRSNNDEPFRQAEILSNVHQHRITVESLDAADNLEVEKIDHTLAVVISQDCDLEQDFKRRRSLTAEGNETDQSDPKLLPTVLLCEVASERTIDDAMRGQGSTVREQFHQNKLERYQFLRAVGPEDDALGEGLEAMGIDFKRYFTVPTTELYAQLGAQCRRRCRLAPQYLEHLCLRFCHFISRVALPKTHDEK